MAAAANPYAGSQKSRKPDRTHFLYIAVIAAVVLGAVIGLMAPEFAKSLKPLGTGFINLIKMMIAPVIFCTIVLGIGSIAKAATVGKVGGLALGYFIIMSTFALAIGLVVGNLIHPGEGLDLQSAGDAAPAAPEEGDGMTGFLLSIIPTTLLASLTGESILQTLFVALLVGFALQKMGAAGAPVLKGIGYIQALVFRILMMIMWLAPIGAFGAIAAVVGETGIQAIVSMATLMIAFYITCILFIVVILGGLLKLVTGFSIFKLMRYLGREYLLIFSTSSSEVALPRLIAKMEHLGISKPVVGVTVPTGYSFNLDGTAIYLTMAALFVASAMGKPLELGEQISLLVFMIVASKGAAGVTGAGLATLAGGLQSHRPDLIEGVGLIVGIDRFMSEARALTNFTGNAVATVLIGTWTKEIDKEQVKAVLDRELPFDEASMNVDAGTDEPRQTAESAELAATVPGPAGSSAVAGTAGDPRR
ncbi:MULTISPECIES: cation:dicarboxylate symporter family transporter [unclassified Arthrobacter]|uniref:cation:dicarboxylate symporter family transporter n=1 Tax=unclassified Arthrobacter TaxID=235627 RepID=UPI001D1336DF|nr:MULTISPECIES: cation:dicarboxylase symporter family transporter [unclassified Arthrobacter]MCC3290668.1 cation:dicarboxylase symporter family transporter [Arthrobacter sp. zg-Y1110]MCC3301944.1 cation:dicarboxylase symporter family transporter [Arthrobacter sp. zg-Y895]UWX86089.1 cation:dicarboxylase symporter family transporter [Arthrobacter sp. zg-Y1110]